MEQTILRGQVIAFPDNADKGLVEVRIGAYDADGDTVLARAAHSMSGVYWLPEIGDVVEVALSPLPGHEAQILHIHRGEQDAQTSACWTPHNDRKQLRSRCGHNLTFDDTQDHTQVTLHTAGGLELVLDDQAQTVTVRKDSAQTPVLVLNSKEDTLTFTAGKALTLRCGGAELSFDSQGNLSICANGTVKLSGQAIFLEAGETLGGKGQHLTFNASMDAALTGQNQLELRSGGITQVKGGSIQLN